MEKESVDIVDLIDILGPRPYPLQDSIIDYLKEIENRRKESKNKKELDEKSKPNKEKQNEDIVKNYKLEDISVNNEN